MPTPRLGLAALALPCLLAASPARPDGFKCPDEGGPAWREVRTAHLGQVQQRLGARPGPGHRLARGVPEVGSGLGGGLAPGVAAYKDTLAGIAEVRGHCAPALELQRRAVDLLPEGMGAEGRASYLERLERLEKRCGAGAGPGAPAAPAPAAAPAGK